MPEPDGRIRQSIRLEERLWAAIDDARTRRIGNISRNSWISEAALEKLLREEPNQKKIVLSGGKDA